MHHPLFLWWTAISTHKLYNAANEALALANRMPFEFYGLRPLLTLGNPNVRWAGYG